MYDYLGITYLGDGGDNEVSKILGTPETMTESMEMGYYGGTSPHYSVDHLASLVGLIFHCEENIGRMVYRDAGDYKVVSSSVVMGALANGDSLNLKPYFMAEMIFRFLDYDPPVFIDENNASIVSSGSCPNPFSARTIISYELAEAGAVKLAVYDAQGRLVKILADNYRDQGRQRISWDATNEAGDRVNPGLYFYRIQSGKTVKTGKMTVH